MALKFSANISWMFQEYGDLLERYQAARNAGEMLSSLLHIGANYDT